MLYRMHIDDIKAIKHFDDLKDRITMYYGCCHYCASYKRLSYSPLILKIVILEHIKYTHNIAVNDAFIECIPVSVSKEKYMLLHDIVIIDT